MAGSAFEPEEDQDERKDDDEEDDDDEEEDDDDEDDDEEENDEDDEEEDNDDDEDKGRDWTRDEDSGQNEEDIPHHDSKPEWIGIVQWSEEEAFSAGGDSGSMVYAMDKQTMIPLGVHLGTPWPKKRSIFICLEAYCLEAKKEGWRLKFLKAEEPLDDGSSGSGEELTAEKAQKERARMESFLERRRA